MFEGFDQDELLAYVEGGLDARRAADLRQRLLARPRALAVLDRLREDRALLRSMEEPAVPADLLAELEPMLARPMLMPSPGDWRRRYRRRRRWVLPAAAACLGVLVPATLWAVISGGRGANEVTLAPPLVEQRPAPGADTVDSSDVAIDVKGVLAEGDTFAMAPAAPKPQPAEPRASVEPAEFVLVVRATDDRALEASLRRCLEALDGEGALVRNFSFKEADALAQRSGTADTRSETAPPIRADAGGDHVVPSLPMRRVTQQRLPSELADPPPASAQLWGRREWAPTYERQLEFSQRGAVYTVAIPAGRVADLLGRLELTEGCRTALRVYRGEETGGTPATTDSQLWLRDYPLVRATLDDLRASPDAVIFLPVVLDRN